MLNATDFFKIKIGGRFKIMQNSINPNIAHNVIIENRKTITVSDVKSIDNFTKNEIVAETNMGILHIVGTNLHLNVFNEDVGELNASGAISAISYANSLKKKKSTFNFLSKVFN